MGLSTIYYKIVGDMSVYFQMYGKYDKAREMCEKSVKNNGNSVTALNLYGIICLQDGKCEEALSSLQKAKSLNKNKVLNRHLTVSIGSCYWLMGDVDRAIKTITGLIDENDYVNPDAYTTLGYMYILKGDYEKSLEVTGQAINDKEDHAPAYDNLGQIYYRKGDIWQAKINFEKALSFNPSMTDSKFYLGLVYEAQGDTASAKECFLSAHGDNVNALNTVTRVQIDAKYEQYLSE